MNRSQSEYCNVGTKTYLTNHPAKKFVFDFMRVMIIDNLCLTPASKQTPLVDLLLEVEFPWGCVLVWFCYLNLIVAPYSLKCFPLFTFQSWLVMTCNSVELSWNKNGEKKKETLVFHKQ